MPVVKSVPINLDKRRRLCFDFNAFAELQRECGISILDLQKFINIAKQNESGKSGLVLPFYELRGFIWAGLLDESPDITLKEVGRILDGCFLERPDELGASLMDAIMQSTFFKEAKKKMAKPKIPSTGAKKTTSKKVTN
jgi:hypothetical protein